MFGTPIGIETVMIFGLGFFVAALLGCVAASLVHNRAVRLTTRRLDAVTPISIPEMQAQKDHLRAEFAVSTRKLEASVEDLRIKTGAHMTELARKSGLIERMKSMLDEKSAALAALESREDALEHRGKALAEELRSAKTDIAAKTSELFSAQSAATAMKAELDHLRRAFDERGRLIDSQQSEMSGLKSEIDNVRRQIAAFAQALTDSQAQTADDWTDEDIFSDSYPKGGGGFGSRNGPPRQ